MAIREATVPDIGGYSDVPVIEVLVKVGDRVSADQGLITLESDKATMEVPAPFAGVIKELRVKLGDAIAEGTVVALIDDTDGGEDAPPAAPPAAAPQAAAPQPAAKPATDSDAPVPASDAQVSSDAPPATTAPAARGAIDAARDSALDPEAGPPNVPAAVFDASRVLPDQVPHASPVVRGFARELGVDLSRVTGSGRGGRISREDVTAYVKGALSAPIGSSAGAGSGNFSVIPWPKVDFSRFGEISTEPLSKIKKISGANLARNWAMIPHVTQFDDADITELEALRVALNEENAKAIAKGNATKLTMLAFLMKAIVSALQKFPTFNASLDATGETLTLKKYFHVGFAADTSNGLVVPVVRDCDRKGVMQIAMESGELAAKARDGKLGPAEMSGGCISISSLGGIGGTAFTPIVNAPEVAILGVSKSSMQPVWNGREFAPRLILPLSLSYDHRVIDGAAAARFTAYLAAVLADLRRMLL